MLELVLMGFMPVWQDLDSVLDQKWRLKHLLRMQAAALHKWKLKIDSLIIARNSTTKLAIFF